MSNTLQIFHRLQSGLNQVILGQEKLVERLLIALLADGHLLVEGAPGLAKTRAIKALGNMIEGDLSLKLPIHDNKYNYIISAGTFTHGHVGASALDELLRISKPGSLFCISINSAYFETAGFERKFQELGENIFQLELRPVQIYFGGEHHDEQATIAIFTKS